jgi:hypothetical protein
MLDYVIFIDMLFQERRTIIVEPEFKPVQFSQCVYLMERLLNFEGIIMNA